MRNSRSIAASNPAPLFSTNRGKRNERAFVARVAERLDEMHGTSLDRVLDKTGRNTAERFDLD